MSVTAPAPAPSEGRPVVSLGELQRAWEAVQAGRFRSVGSGPENTSSTASSPRSGEWLPTETVIPVIGAGGGVGATTLALALATSATTPARVVECCSATASGLASASTAELGIDTGWCRGLRDGAHHPILLERAAAPITTAAAVPLPTDPDRPVAVTFLDCGWDLDHLLADGWLTQLVTAAPALVIAASATIPGLRRLETTLDALQVGRVRVGVLGARRKKWGRPIEGSLGPAIRSLATADGLVEIPLDRDLGTHGLTSTPLPQSLLNAARQLLDRLPAGAPPASPVTSTHREPLVEDQDY